MGIGILSGQLLKVRVKQIKLLVEILLVLIAMKIDSQKSTPALRPKWSVIIVPTSIVRPIEPRPPDRLKC